jgi:hypothetical protein
MRSTNGLGLSPFFDVMAVQRFGLHLAGAASILETFDFYFSGFCAAGIEGNAESSECLLCVESTTYPGALQSQFGHDLPQIMPVAATEDGVFIGSGDETRLLPTNCG